MGDKFLKVPEELHLTDDDYTLIKSALETVTPLAMGFAADDIVNLIEKLEIRKGWGIP